MDKLCRVALLVSLAACSLSASAQFAKRRRCHQYRKSALTVMGTHFGRLGAVAQGKAPFDAKAVADNADIVASMAKLPWAAFVEGSDSGETKAKPEIWKQSAKFKEAAEKLQTESIKLAAAAHTGKEDAFKAAFTATAGTCKSCHDDFRAK
jgi:cytochrome c556